MTRYLTAVVSVLMLAFAFGAWAQSSPPQHQHVAPNLIDGAVHPELIPDSVAYRLYLVAVSTGQNPTEAAQKRQRAHLMKTGVEDTDQRILVSILSDFRAKYDALVSEYNDAATAAAARNKTTDVHTLLKKLDDLVQSTRDTISVRLSSRGVVKIHSFVVSQKKNMKVTED
ncbi:MAG: hypothetical protein DMG48_19570 [Acidobacteria bacterium]|nr:MAG: hypothetical protein DMG48_19570 [Acidobacteriota bacterium]